MHEGNRMAYDGSIVSYYELKGRESILLMTASAVALKRLEDRESPAAKILEHCANGGVGEIVYLADEASILQLGVMANVLKSYSLSQGQSRLQRLPVVRHFASRRARDISSMAIRFDTKASELASYLPVTEKGINEP